MARLRDEAGYSLVEVVVAIMLLGLAIIPMVGMFDAGLRASVIGSNYDKARAIASEELAEIQALPFSSPDLPAANTNNSVVEIYPPSNIDPPPATPRPSDYACTPSVPSGFTCRVESLYARPDASGITLDGRVRTMIRATVTVTWDGKSYKTTGLVSRGAE